MRLVGRRVILEPLTIGHAEALHAAADGDDDLWTYMTAAPRSVPEMRAWVEARLAPRALPALAFAQRDAATGRVAGSTSLFDIDAEAGSAEVGYTWLGAPWRGAGLNAEAKLLLLRHAFGPLSLQRVQLVTNARNLRSQRAIEALGATREGVLRNYRRNLDGTLRDSVVFSILDREWPDVEARLARRVDDEDAGKKA